MKNTSKKSKWDKEMRKLIKDAFDAPEPLRKQDFLRELEREQVSPVSVWKLLLSQIGYISRWIWGLDMGVLIVTLMLLTHMSYNAASAVPTQDVWGIPNMSSFVPTQDVLGLPNAASSVPTQDVLGLLSAVMPILAVAVIAENGRSERFGMAELELSARFSLKSVVLARMAILGVWNLLLFGIFLAAGSRHTMHSFARLGVYLLCPYLLTVFLSLWISRRIPAREAGFACGGIAMLVCAGVWFVSNWVKQLYCDAYVIYWIAALLFLVFGTVKEGIQMVKRTEELEWNL